VVHAACLIGIIHQVIPWGDKEALKIKQRQVCALPSSTESLPADAAIDGWFGRGS
jgi:hypothetical protein